MNKIKINKQSKSITIINNGIAFSQFGIANEILDLVDNQQQEIDRLINLNKQLVEECQRLDDEAAKLNNIINEIEQYLCEIDEDFEWDNGIRVRDMKEYLKELKEENNVQ